MRHKWALALFLIMFTAFSINASQPKYKTYKVAGKIIKIELKKQYLLIKPFWKQSRPMKIYFSESTKVVNLKTHKKASITALKEGKSIAVTYRYYKDSNRKMRQAIKISYTK